MSPLTQALRLATEDPQMTEGSLQQLLDMVVLLPYLGLVHDPTTVQVRGKEWSLVEGVAATHPCGIPGAVESRTFRNFGLYW